MRISTKKIGEQLKAMKALGEALEAARKAGIGALDMSERHGDALKITTLEDHVADWMAELHDEAQQRILEIFGDVDGKVVPGAKRNPELEGVTRDRIAHTLSAAGWDRETVGYIFDLVDDSIADGCFLPEPSGAPTGAASTPADEGEAAAAREGVTFVEPGESLMPAGELAPTTGVVVGGRPPAPVPVMLGLGDCATVVEALELLHDMADAHEDIASEAAAQKKHALDLVSKFKAVIARNSKLPQPREISDAELKARGLRRLEQGDDASQIVEVDGGEYMPIDAPCPGCGCKAGEGLTDGCEDPAGCGYWRALEAEEKPQATSVVIAGPGVPPLASPVPTSLLEVAAAVEGKAPEQLIAEVVARRAPGSTVRPVAVIGDGSTVFEVTSPAGTDENAVAAAIDSMTELEAARLIQAAMPEVEIVELATGKTVERPLPYEPDAPTVLRGPGGITLTLDVREANVEDPGAGTPALVEIGKLSASFECALGEGEVSGERGETQSLELDQTRWLEDQQRHVDELWRQARERHAIALARRERICGALPSFDGAGPCERSSGHEGQHAAKGKRWDAEPTSSACKLKPFCVLQVGHGGPCLPTMMRDGSF